MDQDHSDWRGAPASAKEGGNHLFLRDLPSSNVRGEIGPLVGHVLRRLDSITYATDRTFLPGLERRSSCIRLRKVSLGDMRPRLLTPTRPCRASCPAHLSFIIASNRIHIDYKLDARPSTTSSILVLIGTGPTVLSII
jgi:hypothetical protein